MSSSTNPQPETRGRVDDRFDPSPFQTLGGTPQELRPNIPEWVIDDSFGDWNFPKDDSNESKTIQKFLAHVWTDVDLAFENCPKPKGNLADRKEFLENVKLKGERDFIDSLKAMKESGDWASLFENEVFLKPKQAGKEDLGINKVDSALVKATELAWNSEYQGNAEMVLLETIADLLDKKRSPYARLTSIINSSGTGKSRMVDQLGMKIITVPMCLRSEGTQGFPPPDDDLRNWLVIRNSNDPDAQKRLHGFAYSLLSVTCTALETLMEGKDVPQLPDLDNREVQNMSEMEREKQVACIKERQVWLASTFREKMTSGQSFQTSNKYRKKFYNDVTLSADKFMERSKLVSRETKGSPDRYLIENREGVEQAGERLCRFVDPHRLLDSTKGPRWPLVVFAFDEAHTLTDNPPDKEWSLFLELRRILRQIHNLPIFSLFLSTAGRFNLFSPAIRSDPSNRVRDPSSRPLDPIPEISFDDIAYPALEDSVTLDRVVQMDWMSHLGRPLFGSRWDAMAMNGAESRSEAPLVDFAKQKLLDGPTTLAEDDRPGSLACLSVRFALEFNMDGTARDVAYAQVERHMRLCVAVTTGFEKLVTLAGSEPLLAEAAYELINNTQTNAVRHLAHHSDLNCIDRGRRGELVAALIIMQARDAARGVSSVNSRWVTVAGFMKALLPPSDYEQLRISGPNFWRENDNKPFEETFEGYGMWFNHVIKVEDGKMISVENLWKFVTRGAMIIFSNNQEGVDIVLPLCDTKQKLSRNSMTAILIQVKNDVTYKDNPVSKLFDKMDPFELGIFPEDRPSTSFIPKPVIRLVFALASSKACVAFRERRDPNRTTRSKGHDFTAFDIWLAGLSTDTFRQIGGDLVPYQILLERSLRPHDAFELTDDPLVGEKAKKLRKPRRQRVAPLAYSGPDYEAIHRKKDQEPGSSTLPAD